MAKFSLPSLKAIKLPFGRGGSGLHDPIDEDDFEDDAVDAFDYNAPTKFQKMLPWLLVFGGYLFTVVGVAGTYLYLDSNAEKFEQELIDQRPINHVERIQIAKTRNLQEESEKEQKEKAENAPEDPSASEAVEDSAADPTHEGEAANEQLAEDGASDVEGEAATVEAEAAAIDPKVQGDQFTKMMLPHPDMALVEETNEGFLPIIAKDGREPWRVYSRPFNTFESKPKIAIVVTGLGISEKMTTLALDLPGEVTLAFAPYSTKLSDWVDAAREKGHEVMITLPMEPTDFPKSDPGPYALLTSLDIGQNTKKLNWILSRTTGYVGLIGYQGSKYLTSDSNMRSLASRLKQRGLMYMDSLYSPVNAAPKIMRISGVPYTHMNITLDSPPGRVNVSKKLKELEEEAQSKGVAVAVASPYKTSIERIRKWSEDLSEKNLALVPVSSIAAEGLQN